MITEAQAAPPGASLPPVPDSLRARLQRAAPGEAHATVLLRITDAYLEPFDSAGVVRYAEAAEQEARQAHAPVLAGRALDLRGNYYRQTGDLARALGLLQPAGPLLNAAPDAIQANYRYHLGMAHGDMSQFTSTLQVYCTCARVR